MRAFYLPAFSILYLLLICGGEEAYSKGKEGEAEKRCIRPLENDRRDLGHSEDGHSPEASGCSDSEEDEEESGTDCHSGECCRSDKSQSPENDSDQGGEDGSEVDNSRWILLSAWGMIATVFIFTLVRSSIVYLKKNKTRKLIINTELTHEEIP